MKYVEIKNLREKIYFTPDEVANFLGIKNESANVLCHRYTEKKLFLRLKKDLYILEEKWRNLKLEEKFKIGNILFVPSYISLMTALSYYQLTTQIQREFYESVTTKKRKVFIVDGAEFHYYKINSKYYFGFIKINDFFIAEKEKAFLDCVYLSSLGKYKFDIYSLDLDKLEKRKIEKYLQIYPEKTKKFFLKIWKI